MDFWNGFSITIFDPLSCVFSLKPTCITINKNVCLVKEKSLMDFEITPNPQPKKALNSFTCFDFVVVVEKINLLVI